MEERELCQAQVQYLFDKKAQIKYVVRERGAVCSSGEGFSNSAWDACIEPGMVLYISQEDYDAQPYEFKALYVEALLIKRREYIRAIDETISFHRIELLCAKFLEEEQSKTSIEPLVLNESNQKKLKSIIEYIDRQLHFDVFLDIHSMHSSGREAIDKHVSSRLMNRYKNALCIGQKNLDWLDKYLAFDTINHPLRDKDKITTQNDNIWIMLEFYRDM